MPADLFAAALGAHRGSEPEPAADGGACPHPAPARPYGVRVTLRANDGHGPARHSTWWVGETDLGAVDTDAAVEAAEAHHPGCVYQDWQPA